MDLVVPVEFARPHEDVLERDLEAVVGAIGLVAGGGASRMRLGGLADPRASAAEGLPVAQRARVRLIVEHDATGGATIVVGPRY
jgi:hypothetical protein